MSSDDIIARVKSFEARHVVITGGEPLIAEGIETLTRELQKAGLHITLETAATVWKDAPCDLASISPKLKNSTPVDREGGKWAASHERARLNPDTIRRLMRAPDYQLKFVVDAERDLQEIDTLLSQLDGYDPTNVLLMPQGVTVEELRGRAVWLVDICKQRGFRYCPRIHIELYGNRRGV